MGRSTARAGSGGARVSGAADAGADALRAAVGDADLDRQARSVTCATRGFDLVTIERAGPVTLFRMPTYGGEVVCPAQPGVLVGLHGVVEFLAGAEILDVDEQTVRIRYSAGILDIGRAHAAVVVCTLEGTRLRMSNIP